MKYLVKDAARGIAIGTLISIFFSSLFAGGAYDPVYPHSFMGSIYYNHFSEIQIMIIAVVIWGLIGITFGASSLIFTHLKFSRMKTTILHFFVMLAIFFPLAILAGWFPFKFLALLIFFVVFTVIYIGVWMMLNKKNKETIDEINHQIKQKRTD